MRASALDKNPLNLSSPIASPITESGHQRGLTLGHLHCNLERTASA